LASSGGSFISDVINDGNLGLDRRHVLDLGAKGLGTWLVYSFYLKASLDLIRM
jgi:hypothetical protein